MKIFFTDVFLIYVTEAKMFISKLFTHTAKYVPHVIRDSKILILYCLKKVFSSNIEEKELSVLTNIY